MATEIPRQTSEQPDYGDIPLQGEVLPSGSGKELSPLVSQASFVERHVIERPALDPRKILPELKADFLFAEHPDRIRTWDVIKFVIHHGEGKIDSYEDRLQKAEERGAAESSAFGIATTSSGERFAFFATHFETMGGSLDTAMGEKYVRTLELAKKEGIPCITFFASGGARQQEGIAGLEEMTLMTNEARLFKEETNLPLISILIGKTYGGISAAPVPMGDVVGAMAGADFGFSGGDLMGAFYNKKIPLGVQSEAQNIIDRNIDIYFHTKEEMEHWIENLCKVVHVHERSKKKNVEPEDFLTLPDIKKIPDTIRFPFGQDGFINLFDYHDAVALERLPTEGEQRDVFIRGEHFLTQEALIAQRYRDYQRLGMDPTRLDTEYFSRILEHPVYLYSKYADRGAIDEPASLRTPAIVAAIGTVGSVGVMILGNAHSYELRKGSRIIQKKPSSPKPVDFEYQRRMAHMAERLGIVLVTHTDTLGANPTPEAEKDGQSRNIAWTIADMNAIKTPVLTFISTLGSGGGLTMTPRGERRLMFSDGMAAVADPAFSTLIRLKQKYAPEKEIRKQYEAMKPMAEAMLALGIVDGIIPVHQEATSKHPEQVLTRVRQEIIRFAIEHHNPNIPRILRKRNARIRETNKVLRARSQSPQ